MGTYFTIVFQFRDLTLYEYKLTYMYCVEDVECLMCMI